MRDLNREVSSFVLEDLLNDLLTKYADLPSVLDYLDAVRNDVVEHLNLFLGSGEDDDQGAPLRAMRAGATVRRYHVNLLVDSSGITGAPVVSENNPSYMNLIGRVEQMAQMGALLTDFTLIKPGVLHRANGGYLIIDARESADQSLRLGGAQTCAPVPSNSHRVAPGNAQPDQHGLA